MLDVRAITICYSNTYADLLAITLPRNMKHLTEALVVCGHEDDKVREVVASVPNARHFTTDAPFRHGAYFNKGLAMEEGFDALGRHGWIMILDSDIILPRSIPWDRVRPNFLNGCRRRICDPVNKFRDDLDWRLCPVHIDGGPIGYMQLFQAESACLAGKRPWYHVGYPHAGGCDAFFIEHWPVSNRCVIPFDVLHLGAVDRHWFGTSPEAIDKMGAYVHKMGWKKAMQKHDPKSQERVGELIDRVDVPGYEKSDYMMPFEKRAKR